MKTSIGRRIAGATLATSLAVTGAGCKAEKNSLTPCYKNAQPAAAAQRNNLADTTFPQPKNGPPSEIQKHAENNLVVVRSELSETRVIQTLGFLVASNVVITSGHGLVGKTWVVNSKGDRSDAIDMCHISQLDGKLTKPFDPEGMISNLPDSDIGALILDKPLLATGQTPMRFKVANPNTGDRFYIVGSDPTPDNRPRPRTIAVAAVLRGPSRSSADLYAANLGGPFSGPIDEQWSGAPVIDNEGFAVGVVSGHAADSRRYFVDNRMLRVAEQTQLVVASSIDYAAAAIISSTLAR